MRSASATLSSSEKEKKTKKTIVGRTALQEFHNVVQREQYNDYLHPGQTLVELGSGNGGPLLKIFPRCPSHVLNIDIDPKRIQQAQERVRNLFELDRSRDKQEFAKKLSFYCGDLTQTSTYAALRQSGLVLEGSKDVFSSQFSLTYLWQSKSAFCNLLYWISASLKPGGYFIGTVTDGDEILHLCSSDNKRKDTPTEFHSSIADIEFPSDRRVVREHDSSADDVSNLATRQMLQMIQNQSHGTSSTASESAGKSKHKTEAEENVFGRPIRFRLENSIISEGVLEYLVSWSTFVELADYFSLRLVSSQMFGTRYKTYKGRALSREERTISFLNRCFVFQKQVK